ncbi:MAG: glycerol-3-phosphate acyltransferase [Chloroflexi bacterium]|nr:glycerol-3-phosphate acyltransferase [Chloroflexota bacterium]
MAILVAYLLGSIPTAYLITRQLKGVDIREVGDRNMGTTNVYYVVGAGAAAATAIGDIAKGAVAMLVARALGVSDTILILVALAAVSGHIWPVFLGFRGGAGFATTLGVLVVALPRETAILIVPYVLIGATVGRRIGMGEAAAFLLIPFMALSWWLGESPQLIVLPLILGVFLAVNKYWGQIGKALRMVRP